MLTLVIISYYTVLLKQTADPSTYHFLYGTQRTLLKLQSLDLRDVAKEAIEYDPLNREKPWMVIGTKCDMLHRDPLLPALGDRSWIFVGGRW